MSEGKLKMSAPERKKLEYEIEISAPVEAVWKALTEAAELVRWFPLESEATAGVGGSVKLSWGPGMEGTASIVAWEPNRRVQWKAPAPPAPGDTEPAGRFVIMDWILEGRGGKTVLRLVHSGFSGADWEKEYFESTQYGWTFMLHNLRLYLEQHKGVPRVVVWPRRKVVISRDAAFEKLMASGGLFAEAAAGKLREGERYTLRTGAGDTYSGKVEFVRLPRGFCVRVENLNDALFWLSIEGPVETPEVQLWLSAYGLPKEKIEEFRKSWTGVLEKLFPEMPKN